MSKTLRVISAAVLLFLFCFYSEAQEAKPASGGVGGGTCADCISFKSPRVFLQKNMEESLSFEALYFEYRISLDPNKEGEKTSRAMVKIYSYGKSLKYLLLRNSSPESGEKVSARFFIDGNELKQETPSYAYFREMFRDENTVKFRDFKPQIKNGKVLDEKEMEVTGTIGEAIFTAFALPDFRKFAGAKKIEIRIGEEKFLLTDRQAGEIKAVAEHVIVK
jgi:hypothetical protein